MTLVLLACLAAQPARGDERHAVPTVAIALSVGAALGTGVLLWHGGALLLDFLLPAPEAVTVATPAAPAPGIAVSMRQVARRLHATWRHSAHKVVVAIHAPSPPVRDHAAPVLPTYKPWLDPRVGIAQPERHGMAHLLDVQCEACVTSAAGAEVGEDSIQKALDLQALTIIQVGGASVKLTSLRPFSLLFKQHF